jgi:hypothetical protein
MKVIPVLVLTLGSAISAFAGACSGSQSGSLCAAAADGTTFTVSLLGLTNPTLQPNVNVNVVANASTVAGTDTFTVTVASANTHHYGAGASGFYGFATNFDVTAGGNSNAAVTAVSSTITGGAVTTNINSTAGDSLASWSIKNGTTTPSAHTIAPTFVSAEIDNGINILPGSSILQETYTVVWTAYHPAATSATPPPAARPFIVARDPLHTLDPAVAIAPEPASFGLMIFAGGLGAFYMRRRLAKR